MNNFDNNCNNVKNLPILTDTDIIFGDETFKIYVHINDGIYYLDNNWQYIVIKNGLLVEKYYYNNCNDKNPLFVTTIENKDNKLYEYTQYYGVEKKLNTIMPNDIDAFERIVDFLNILDYSGYKTIGNPVEYVYFVNPNFNNGHKNIRIANGQIVSKNSLLV